MNNNKITTYLLYAIGEIILVVVGILIAVQIDNWNEANKERKMELHYLKNIKEDLRANIKIIDQFIYNRDSCIHSAEIIISHLEGAPVTDWKAFNEHCINIYDWRRYYRVNTTFEELTYSGNLGLISNDTIKTQLLNLESMFMETKGEEDHFRFDSEEIIYKPLYNLVDLHPSLRKYGGEDVELNYEMYKNYFADIRVKNGFLMVILELSKMNGQLAQMKEVSQQLIKTIDLEIAKK
ncbi:MAG: DUF6090 family protein [Fulvivirga sp.]|uniref:DUF6090 family protein n=1 Tax=Fulvivirga sp. TaxID=1931237 RepID=UPI0032EAD108